MEWQELAHLARAQAAFLRPTPRRAETEMCLQSLYRRIRLSQALVVVGARERSNAAERKKQRAAYTLDWF